MGTYNVVGKFMFNLIFSVSQLSFYDEFPVFSFKNELTG